MPKKEKKTVTDSPKGNSNLLTKPNITPLLKRILSLEEACSYLSISKGTMYKYLGEEKIRGFKYQGSRTWKFDIEQLNEWVKEQQGIH